jgi:putative SOS response-associated peptidase YedK
MCGRVRLGTDFAQIRIELQFDETAPLPNMAASWNVCPTDPMLVAINVSGKRTPQQMRWGLVPWWAKDIKVGFSSINARAETIDTTRAFRDAWKRGQRCLVVTDGFYEWKKSEKQPYAVGMADDDLMVMAGLWDEWKSPQGSGSRAAQSSHARRTRLPGRYTIGCPSSSRLIVGAPGSAMTPLPTNSRRCSRRAPMRYSRCGRLTE